MEHTKETLSWDIKDGWIRINDAERTITYGSGYGRDANEGTATLEDFVSGKTYWNADIRSAYGEKTYQKILAAAKKRCSGEFQERIEKHFNDTINFLKAIPVLKDYQEWEKDKANVIVPQKRDASAKPDTVISINGLTTSLHYVHKQAGFEIIQTNANEVIYTAAANNIVLDGLFHDGIYYLKMENGIFAISEKGETVLDHTHVEDVLELFGLGSIKVICNLFFVSYGDRTEQHNTGWFCIDIKTKKIIGRIFWPHHL